MEATAGLQISDKPSTFLRDLTRPFKKLSGSFTIVVLIYEVPSGIVRGINVNHLYSTQESFLDYLERFEIVPLEEQVLRIIKIDTFRAAGPQCLGGRRIRKRQRLPLPWPIQPI